MKKKNDVKENYAVKGKESKHKKRFEISIRLQLILAFLMLIVFIVLVGGISYNQASDSLAENYINSSRNTLHMTARLLDDSLKNVQNNLAELSQDGTVKSYALGAFADKSSLQTSTRTTLSTNINVKQTATSMIHNIHIITVADEQFLSTQTLDATGDDGFIDEVEASEDGYLLDEKGIVWGSYHPFLNSKLKTEEDDYALFCSRVVASGKLKGLVVVDVSAEEIKNHLNEVNFGEGSQVSFITAAGKEIKNGDITDIVTQDIFVNNKDNIAEEGFADYITFDGKEYFFMMDKCNIAEAYVCAMVPVKAITAGSDSIKLVTITLLVIACIAAIITSSILTRKISRNIKHSVNKLDKVSQGELNLDTSDWKKEGGEFGKLQDAIYITIDKISSLVVVVKDMIGKVSDTGVQISGSSVDVSEAVDDMSEKIEHIHATISKEDSEVASCYQMMEELSNDIKHVSQNLMEIIDDIDKSEEIICSGMEAVNAMAKQSGDTSKVTDEVSAQVTELGDKMEEISHFVESIQEIADETNLLSLNASIEAARAGEHGRGFSVVAEEIGKLAVNSSAITQTIQSVISEVRALSVAAVSKAKTAEDIVALQVESTSNTESAFEHIRSFMTQLSGQMEGLTRDVEKMNGNRHETFKAVKRISELSEDTIASANSVSDSLKQQVSCMEVLEKEASNLDANMKELELAVASFKLGE